MNTTKIIKKTAIVAMLLGIITTSKAQVWVTGSSSNIAQLYSPYQYVQGTSANNYALYVQTPSNGYIGLGPQNPTWCHVETDRPQFYFSSPICINGGALSSYNNYDLSLQTGNTGSGGTTRITCLHANGNVGIGTTSPYGPLQVGVGSGTGGLIVSCQNIDPRNYALSNYHLANTGMLLLGWNYTAGGGESDLISNRSGGGTGGFNFYDYSNSGGIVTTLMTLTGNGDANITGTLTLGADAANNWTTSSGSPYTQATSSGSWAVPLIIPNGSTIRTASTGSLGRYLGFGMVDGPSSTTSTTGWYWMVQGSLGTASGCSGSGTSAAYPMALTLDQYGNATLTVSQNGWCDFVFDSSYTPMSIEEKEKYYKMNKHLPGIDSAEVIDNKGLNINKNMKGMMQNVEEDRLDITALYKVIKQQQEEIELLKKKVETLSK